MRIAVLERVITRLTVELEIIKKLPIGTCGPTTSHENGAILVAGTCVTEVVAAIQRITGGNFRLLQRLFTQIKRMMQINELRYITKEIVESARESLVIGS